MERRITELLNQKGSLENAYLICHSFKILVVTAGEPLGISVHAAFPNEIKTYVYKIRL